MNDGAQLTIFMYHAVVQSPLQLPDDCFLDASLFRGQVEYLGKHSPVLPLTEAIDRLTEGRLEGPAAVMTFDDGFQNNYDVAFPVLRELGMPATIFLTTGLVDTSDTLWYCRLNRALVETEAGSLAWNGDRFDLSSLELKETAASAIKASLKELPQPRLLTALRTIVEALGDEPDRPIEIGSPFRMLSREAVADMAASGLIEFGAHTQSHAILSLLSPQERHDEIVHSVTAVRDLTGRNCTMFAYPNGRERDYGAEDGAVLESCGVRAALTAVWGRNDRNTPLMKVRRYAVGRHLSLERFKERV